MNSILRQSFVKFLFSVVSEIFYLRKDRSFTNIARTRRGISHLKSGVFELSSRLKTVTGTLALLFLAFGVIYIFEFNAILNMGDTISELELTVKQYDNELDKSEALYSRIYSGAIQSNFENNPALERVSKIDFIEKKPLVASSIYMP